MQRETCNYVSHYQNYLDSKENKNLPQDSYSDPTQTKIAHRFRKNHTSCKLCKLITRREDVTRILNQGLYNKFTSSIDYYFTKDINALLTRKRKPFCIKYYDDLIYDTPKEFLKKFFTRREVKKHMADIKEFYTKFKDFPRFFDLPFSRIMNSMIRKHRRLEYFLVFKGKKLEEASQIEPLAPEDEFELLEMLGESFKQQLYTSRRLSLRSNTSKLQPTQPDDNSLVQIQKNFKELKSNLNERNMFNMDNPFSSDYYQYYTTVENFYPLYSRSDSDHAIESLADLVSKLKTDNYAKPKLKHGQQSSSKGMNQTIGSTRWNSPTTKNKNNKQPSNFPIASVTPHSRRNCGSMILSESAKTLALANKIFSNPNLSRQTQRNLVQESRCKSEKASASPTARTGVKSVRGLSSEKTDSRFFGGRERQPKMTPAARLTSTQGSMANLKINSNEVTSIANVSAGKKKLLIDVQDININRTSLYKTITDKFKSTCNLNTGSRIQLPGRDFTPYIDSALEAGRLSSKFSFNSGKKLLIPKRSDTAGRFGRATESGTVMAQNDESCNQSGTGLRRRKRSAQSNSSNRLMDKILQAHHANTSTKVTNASRNDGKEEFDANQVRKLPSEGAYQNIGNYGDENSNLPIENASKRVFKRVMSCGIQSGTSSKNQMQILRGGTPQTTSTNLINEILKLIETPDSKAEITSKPKRILLAPQSVKSLSQNKRSKSSHPFFGKINQAATPKPNLQMYSEAFSSNHKRNRSAESKNMNVQASPKRTLRQTRTCLLAS